MAQGVVKSYDPNSGSGIVLLDTDKTEVYIQPGSLKDSIFRTLRQGQRTVSYTHLTLPTICSV